MSPLRIKVINRKQQKGGNDLEDDEKTHSGKTPVEDLEDDETFDELSMDEEESSESSESMSSDSELSALSGGSSEKSNSSVKKSELTSDSDSDDLNSDSSNDDSDDSTLYDFDTDELDSNSDDSSSILKKNAKASVESIIAQSERSINTYQNNDIEKIDKGTYEHKDIVGGREAKDIITDILSGGYKQEMDTARNYVKSDDIYKNKDKNAPFTGGYIKNVNSYKIIDAYPYVIKSSPSYN